MKIIDLNQAIAEFWDAFAEERYNQISSGLDISYAKVLTPSILSNIKDKKLERVLDFGCGLGFLTKEIAKQAITIDGIDISSKSIQIANERNSADNIRYICTDIFTHLNRQNNKRIYDCVVSNMVFMDTPNFVLEIQALNLLMIKGGFLVFTITHPAFWPIYWDYFQSKDFDYNSEKLIEQPFKTSYFNNSKYKTIHFHRPLSFYLNNLIQNGFSIELLEEPKLNTQTFIEDYNYTSYPRFLTIVVKKVY